MINALDIKATAYLHARGITAETIARYRIGSVTHKGRCALRYPTFGDKGAVGWRIKYIDGGKGKYEWVEKNGVNYYSPGMLLDAIEANNGTLYILNGEPSTWAHHAYQIARGVDPELAAPSLSWFGEGSMPQTLADDLQTWGVKNVLIFADCDEAGYRAALKVFNYLQPVTGFMVGMVDLPFEYGSKKDFNDLWVASQFDAAKMPKMDTLTREVIYTRAPELRPKPQPQLMTEAFRPTTNGNGNHGGDVDFKTMQREWVDSIIQALGSPDKMEGRVPRWHCPLPNHTDNDPSFTVDYKVMRPRCTCGIHDRDTAWDEVAHAKGLPAWLEYRKEQLAKQAPQKAAQAPTSANNAPIQKRQFRKGSDVLNSLDNILAGDTSAIGNPVMFPFRTMHFLGGLCKYIPAGMLVGVVGGSGEGKTSFVETCVDFWNKGGIDVIFYSPEWTSELVMQRRIQRYSGFSDNPHVTVDDFTATTLYYKERDLGIPEHQRDGRLFSSGQKQAYDSTKKQLLSWKGETLIACDDDSTAPLYLETFLEMTADTLSDTRRAGRRADVVAVDYLQLAEVLEDKKNAAIVNQVIDKIKRHATLHKYVGFDASQITKASSKAQKTGGGMVTGDDAMAVRSDKFNLMLTINRVFKEENGENIPTDLAHIYVDKNSLGRAKRKLLYRTDYSHLRWVDEIVEGFE